MSEAATGPVFPAPDGSGLGILDVTDGGRAGRLTRIIRLTNACDDGVERADPHGLRVRREN